ncbi:MAG: hypothetical protein JWO51_4822 [Rhodospirillales bacterium]|nr:hypothetical protein [Rhodospirillales bacterium]
MSKDRQRKRKRAAAKAGALHPTKGWQKTNRRPDTALEERAWVTLKRAIVEPYHVLHDDDDPEQPGGLMLDYLFEMAYRWTDGAAGFAPVPIVDLLAVCLADNGDAPLFDRAALLAGIDELAAGKQLTVEGDSVSLTVDPDLLTKVNTGRWAEI